MDIIMSNLNTLVVAGIGGVLFFCLDRVLYFVILNLYPERFFSDVARTINSNLESLKKKYPQAGTVAEQKIIVSLNEAIKIINE